MIKKSIKVCIIIYSFIFARDIYVSKAALAQYETDDYLLFDTFNDSLEATHKTHPNYHPAIDAVAVSAVTPVPIASLISTDIVVSIPRYVAVIWYVPLFVHA